MSSTHNADPAELAKFSDLAHRWWDKQSEFRPLHEINPLRLDWIAQLCPLPGKRVVDVGCGGGILADAMARRGRSGTGVEDNLPRHSGVDDVVGGVRLRGDGTVDDSTTSSSSSTT